ncbi:MAG: substrate-binding domain-containing protein [Paracoccaceae bacterium]|nr:substrate-binding domain-containing protein [Paracoccaceae bacterium]
MPALAAADMIRIGGTGASLGPMKILAEAYEEVNPELVIEVLPSLGSGGGIRALTEGALDFSMSARPLKDKEKAAVEGMRAIPYGRTPLVVIANPTVPVDELSLDQLVAIYTGETTQWEDGSPIRIVTRPLSESDVQIQREISPEMANAVDVLMDRDGLVIARSDQLNAGFVEDTPGSFGVAPLAQIIAEDRRVKLIALEGDVPTADLARDPSNDFAKTFRIVVRPDISEAAQGFVDFIFSPEGMEILEANGYYIGVARPVDTQS